MTLVAALNREFDLSIVADARLSTIDARGQVETARNVCQKVMLANAWSPIALPGDLCLGRFLLNGVLPRTGRQAVVLQSTQRPTVDRARCTRLGRPLALPTASTPA
jgi:hypothetical protein